MWFILFVTTWFTLCFFDVIFKSCMLFPYLQMLERSGITIKPFYLKCYMTCFNRSFVRWSQYHPKFLQIWFAVGAFVSTLFIVPAILLLMISAIKFMLVKEKHEMDSQMLQPVVPGINLPLSQIFYYLLTLFVCSIFHELGHALAAAREGVPIEGSGFFIFGVVPAGFVDMESEKISFSSPWQQLMIFSAGVWHNIVLCCVTLSLLLGNSVILSPMFQQNHGVSVVSIAEGSGASGPSGLEPTDLIYSINGCQVDNMDTWKSCLIKVGTNPPSGFCIPYHLLQTSNSKEIMRKCDEEYCKNSSSHLCFSFIDQDEEELNSACLPVRKAIQSEYMCSSNDDCRKDSKFFCGIPVLNSLQRLIIIGRTDKSAVLYLGSVSELFESVSVSSWIPTQRFLSVSTIEIYETFLKYVFSFSGALAILNLIPCPGLDGQWLCQTLVDWLLFVSVPKRSHRNTIVWFLKLCGFTLISLNIILGLYKLLN